MKTRLCFIAGTKGGVGKSFAACNLLAAAEDLAMTAAVFDSDSENATLINLLGKKAEFLDDAKEDYPLDRVISRAFETNAPDLIIVDMKAGTSRSTMDWFAAVPWGRLPPKTEICVIGALTVDPDAAKTLSPWLVYFEQNLPSTEYIIILNQKDGRDFYAYQKVLRPSLLLLQKGKFNEVIFPAMDKNYISILNNRHMTLRDAIRDQKLDIPALSTIMAQARLHNYYHGFVDPLIELLARWIPQEELSDARKKTLADARKRNQARKA